MRAMRFLRPLGLAALLTFPLGPVTAEAAIYAPGEDVPGLEGEAFGWNRGDANSTYSGWDRFELTVLGGAPFTDTTPDLGSFGATSDLSVAGGYLDLSTGSANLYSPFTALDFNSVIRTDPAGGDFTRIVAQWRTAGARLDDDNLFLSLNSAAEGTIAPSVAVELSRGPFGGPGGELVDYMAIWDLNSSQSEYRIDFNAAESSLSLDQFHVDTFSQSSAFSTPSAITAIPEPTSFAFLVAIVTVAAVRRRRRGN